jgi:hypothetical protein
MILIDALYINNSGGKILLDYLIVELNKTNKVFYYLLDERIRNNHPKINSNCKYIYLRPNIFYRHWFLYKNKTSFSTIFCFGNLPPSISFRCKVITYFHQPLFLNIPSGISIINRFSLFVKSLFINYFKRNSNFWFVQSDSIKASLSHKFSIEEDTNSVFVFPFYPSFDLINPVTIRHNVYIYISNGEIHKNHIRLINAFIRFYDEYNISELHLTVEKRYNELFSLINELILKGYPIINHEYLDRDSLHKLYTSSKYLIYPSLAESFGLGLIEGIECGCKVIGASLPYLYSVCKPSATFNPYSVDDIYLAFEASINNDLMPSELLQRNKIVELINEIID